MKKLFFYSALCALSMFLMSNSGCNGFYPPVPVPYQPDPNSPYECLDAYNNYINPDSLGTIKSNITDTAQYGYILNNSVNGDKYYIVPTPNIMAASPHHFFCNKKGRVITYRGGEKAFSVDNLVCCGYYRTPFADQPHQVATMFYDCKTTGTFINNIHIVQ